MNLAKNQKIAWVDLLCISTIFHVIANYKNIEILFYLNTTKTLSFFIKLISNLTGITIKQITDVVESTERIGKTSLYELIQIRLDQYLFDWVEGNEVKFFFDNLHYNNNFNIRKYKEHLRENAFYYLYKPVQIQILSEKYGNAKEDLFFLKKNAFHRLHRSLLNFKNVKHYRSISFSGWLIEKRSNYYFDKIVNPLYYSSSLYIFLRFFGLWFFSSIVGIVIKPMKMKERSIGVELVQSKVCLDEINDLYWLDAINDNNKNVIGISFVDYDRHSMKVLNKLGINYFRISDHILKTPKIVFNNYTFTTPGKDFFQKTINLVIGAIPLLWGADIGKWLDIQSRYFSVRTTYWMNIYRSFNIYLLWSMLDIDSEKNIKSQAIESIGGLFIGSHWSNYPLYSVLNQKCYDVFFAWSKHFVKHNIVSDKIFITGYPSDHYFSKQSKMMQVRSKDYKDLFVISFHDNIVSNDLAYSMKMQIDIHSMFIELIKKYKHLKVILKPKRIASFQELTNNFPELEREINNGRIEVFLGESNTTKQPPAKIGALSDLAIGLGISTAIAECSFSGTIGFHVDLTRFQNNEFAEDSNNKFVYRNIKDLKIAIENQISGTGFNVGECQDFHKKLDPFQDGKAYFRAGQKINDLFESVNNA